MPVLWQAQMNWIDDEWAPLPGDATPEEKRDYLRKWYYSAIYNGPIQSLPSRTWLENLTGCYIYLKQNCQGFNGARQ